MPNLLPFSAGLRLSIGELKEKRFERQDHLRFRNERSAKGINQVYYGGRIRVSSSDVYQVPIRYMNDHFVISCLVLFVFCYLDFSFVLNSEHFGC